MTNEQLQTVKRFIKMKYIKDILPIDIPNWEEKLAGNNGRGKGRYFKERSFDEAELSMIYSALAGVAHTIINDYKTEK